MLTQADQQYLVELVRAAGRRILTHYGGETGVTLKADQSPLTDADRSSHHQVTEGLRQRWPECPILSEEGAEIAYEKRRRWQTFWLVDPLDGTKEFLRCNGEFTVNIALIVSKQPVFGVVGVPVTQTVYLGGPERGAWRETSDGMRVPIRCSQRTAGERLTVVGSRSHGSPEMADFLKHLPVKDLLAVGSSLKFCRVAEGEADVYPRFGPTMEWDTAAGHAVVIGAGGHVVDSHGRPLRYNKEDLHNDAFLVSARQWQGNWRRRDSSDALAG